MCRYITDFAFGANCGILGANGCAGSNKGLDVVLAVPKPHDCNKEPSASDPKPKAHSFKKCRRVCMRQAASSASFTRRWLYSSFCVMILILSNHFIQVEQRIRYHNKGCGFRVIVFIIHSYHFTCTGLVIFK